jgi:hypothetical protein
MDDPESAIKRLLSLPSVINWARHNKRRLDETRRRLLSFAQRPPRHSLQPVGRLCAKIAARDLSLSQAMAAAGEITSPLARLAAREIIPAFTHEAEKRQFEAVRELIGFELPYPIGKAPNGKLLLVPIRPSFVLIENELLKPVFFIGWATLNLDDFQKQLISSIIARSILTHQYFLSSDAEVLCLPRIRGTKERYPRSWSVNAYNLLSDAQLSEQFDRYSTALQQVVRTLRAG